MSYAVKILADSIAFGVRLVTFEATFPRIILAELNTHRLLSRNSASSRAIPVERRIEQVRANPFVPEAFGKNKSGMSAEAIVEGAADEAARASWLRAAHEACDAAEALRVLGVHKQHANRILEPFVWHTAVITATEWDNFFALRCHPAAQPEMQITANLMREAMVASTPRELDEGDWHLPYVTDTERAGLIDLYDDGTYTINTLVKVSVARCAAISFERQAAAKEYPEFVKRHDEMVKMGHWSPFEHQAQVASTEEIHRHASFRMTSGIGREDTGPRSFEEGFIGNFRAPWLQYRKTFAGESVFVPESGR